MVGVLIALLAWRFPEFWNTGHLSSTVPISTDDRIEAVKQTPKGPGSSEDADTLPKKGTHSPARAVPQEPAAASKPTATPSVLQVNSAPNGIAIGGGIVTNPTVNNFAPPSRRLSTDQRNNLKAAVSGTKARVIIWFFGGDDTQQLAQDLYDVFQQSGWEMATLAPEGAIQVEPQKCDVAIFIPGPPEGVASSAAVEVVTALKSTWMHLAVGVGLSDKVPQGAMKLVIGPRWAQ